MKILVRGPLTANTDFGSTTLGLVKALTSMGASVFLEPTFLDSDPPRNIIPLLTKEPEPPYDLCISHGEPELLAPSPQESIFNVAWTGVFHQGQRLENFRERFQDFDAVLSYDNRSLRALDLNFEFNGLSTKPLMVLAPGFYRDTWLPVNRDWNGRLSFCATGNFTGWSDNFTALQVFKELKDESEIPDSEFNVWSPDITDAMKQQLEEWQPDIHIISGDLLPSQQAKFYTKNHVLFALSSDVNPRSTYQFASMAGVVAALNDGINVSWLNSLYAYPIYSAVETSVVGTVERRPSRDHLKKLMLEFYDKRDSLRRIGEAAAVHVPSMTAWDEALDRMFLMLADNIPSKGQELRMKAMFCHGNEPTDSYGQL